jgi:hypothetical protein
MLFPLHEEDKKNPMAMGHWFFLVLNLKLKKFEVIDSLRTETNVELTESVTKAKIRISSHWDTYTTQKMPCDIVSVWDFPITYINGYIQRGM